MSGARISLIVLRVADLERAAAFYRILVVSFAKHSHGSGPIHYAHDSNGVVLELYPATPEYPVSASTRIGFTVKDVSATVERLAAFPGAQLLSPPKESEWGWRAVVCDPDGHRVELMQVAE